MKTFVCTTLGCKVNRYESEALCEKLLGKKWQYAENEKAANLCIINTCTVTGKAAMQSRQAVRKEIRRHPKAVIIVTGCYAQIAPEIFSAIPGVDWVVDNCNKHNLLKFIDAKVGQDHAKVCIDDIAAPRPFQDLPLTSFGTRTRAFVKIQDGCDAFCSYCIVPYARGRSRSLRPETVLDRVERLTQKGYGEVVFCGIHIGQYGQDLTPAISLEQLFRDLDRDTVAGRLRLSSIEPMEVTRELVQYMADSDRICPHLHIPLQSGDNEVLKAMSRPYSVAFYRDLIHHILRVIPHCAIGVDVMAGFPGETDRAFENTYRLIEKLPLAYLHVFPFSLHKGTAAEKLGNPVPPQTIKKRCLHLRRLGQQKRQTFYDRAVGTSQEILVEGTRHKETGFLKGFTKNYIPVLMEGDDRFFHRTVSVKIVETKTSRVFGKLLS